MKDETRLGSPSLSPLEHCKDPFLPSIEFNEVSPTLALARGLSICSEFDVGTGKKQDSKAGQSLGQTEFPKKRVTVSTKTKLSKKRGRTKLSARGSKEGKSSACAIGNNIKIQQQFMQSLDNLFEKMKHTNQTRTLILHLKKEDARFRALASNSKSLRKGELVVQTSQKEEKSKMYTHEQISHPINYSRNRAVSREQSSLQPHSPHIGESNEFEASGYRRKDSAEIGTLDRHSSWIGSSADSQTKSNDPLQNGVGLAATSSTDTPALLSAKHGDDTESYVDLLMAWEYLHDL